MYWLIRLVTPFGLPNVAGIDTQQLYFIIRSRHEDGGFARAITLKKCVSEAFVAKHSHVRITKS